MPSDSEWLLLRLPSDDFKLSSVLLRRARSEDDLDAAGTFLNITVYLSSGGFGILMSSLGSDDSRVGLSTDFLVSATVLGDGSGDGSSNIVLPSLLDLRFDALFLNVSSSSSTRIGGGGGHLVGCSGA